MNTAALGYTTDEIISITKRWLNMVVIGWGLCPFAKSPYEHDRIHYRVLESIVDLRGRILEGYQLLDEKPEVETMLLIFPSTTCSFGDWYETVQNQSELLGQRGYLGQYQCVCFHPEFKFGGDVPSDDMTHHVNRSPFAMIHILRESSITAVVENGFRTEDLLLQNHQRLSKESKASWAAMMGKIIDPNTESSE